MNQEEANRDVLKLLDLKDRNVIPWVGLSVEPMQGAIDLTDIDPNGIQTIDALLGHSTTPDWAGWCAIDWVTCGGESGPEARPMHPAWVQSLRDQCKAAKTPFLFRQWGEWKPISQMDDIEIAPLYRSTHKAKPHQDQELIDDLYGKTCKVATSCLQLGGNHSASDELGS